MLEKKRKHFNSARTEWNILTDIISKITSSGAHKVIGKAALKGAAKDVKTGTEEGSKQVVKKIADKATKANNSSGTKSKLAKSSVSKDKSKMPQAVELPPTTNLKSNNNPDILDDKTRKLLDSLKTGRGIKLLI